MDISDQELERQLQQLMRQQPQSTAIPSPQTLDRQIRQVYETYSPPSANYCNALSLRSYRRRELRHQVSILDPGLQRPMC
jgi:hypothetical protein